jgi:hypothetical protein
MLSHTDVPGIPVLELPFRIKTWMAGTSVDLTMANQRIAS